MKHLRLLIVLPVVLAFLVGCSKEEPATDATADNKASAEGKQKMEGIGAESVGLTDAGANADAQVGSKVGQ
jgi:hypothetical protein